MTLPPLPDGHPHWVKCYADGGTIMAARNSRKTRGVYWSIRCEHADGVAVQRHQDLVRFKTNNDAEWLAVREALRYVAQHHADQPVVIYSDSQLVVKQFNGEWRTKVARHHTFRAECKSLASLLRFVVMQWVPRAVNVDKLGH